MATVPKSNMGPTKAVPTPFGCIGCKLPKPDYPPALIIFMFCAMVITVVVDLIGNSMVILAVTKNKKLRNSGKLPLFSLPREWQVCNALSQILPSLGVGGGEVMPGSPKLRDSQCWGSSGN